MKNAISPQSSQQTIAQALIQEGRELGVQEGREWGVIEAKRDVLMMQLRTRFGALSPSIVQQIQSISEIDRLDTLLNRLLMANSLAEIGIE